MSESERPKSIVITGSRQGIGRALCEHYLGRGYHVFGISRSPTDLTHRNYKHFEADVSDATRIRPILQEIDALLSHGLEVVVNNAGISLSRMALLTDGVSAQKVLNTNVVGSFVVTREATAIMMRRGFGRIVSISSIEAVISSPGAAIYAASKVAVEKMTEAFSCEITNVDITFNAIGISLFPGTGMTRGLGERARDAKVAKLSRPALLKVEEIAHVVDFLASPLASAVTNQVLYFGGVR